jgi:hypothetical protein
MSAAKTNSLDWRRMALYLVAGVAVIAAALAMVPPPKVPPVAQAVRRSDSETRGDAGAVSVRPASGGMTAGGPAASVALGGPPEARPETPAASDELSPPAGEGVAEGEETAAAESGPRIRNLFSPLVARPKEQPLVVTAPVLPSGPAPVLPAARPAPSAPSAPAAPAGPSARDIQMLGVVELGGQPQVLLKKTTSGESRYFAKGEDAFGFTVEEIQEGQVALKHQGKTERVMMSSAVVIQGPGSMSASAAGTFGGFRSREGGGGGGAPGGGFGRSGARGERGDRGNGGGGGVAPGAVRPGAAPAGAGGGGFSTTEIMSLPTWAERLKKLDEVKGQMDADRYERLRSFMQRKLDEEKATKK